MLVCVFKETCRKLAALIDRVDEERYDLHAKVGKADKEVQFELPVSFIFLELYSLY